MPTDFRLSNAAPAEPPFWTELGFNQCANCPLNEREHPHCPAALQMASAFEPLKALVSFDTVGVTVMQAERTVYAETSAQQAMSSVLGSDHGDLRLSVDGSSAADGAIPSAVRERSGNRLPQHLHVSAGARNHRCRGAPGFAALEELYKNLHVVNRDMSRRLGAATRTDPARNAMALLDAYTTLLPAALECSLDELRPLFDAWQTKRISAI